METEPEVDLGLDDVSIPLDGAGEAIAELNNIGRGQPSRPTVNATPASTAPVPKSQDPMGNMRTADLPDEVAPKRTNSRQPDKASAPAERKTDPSPPATPPASFKAEPWFQKLTITDFSDKDFLANVPAGPVKEVLERVQSELQPHFDRIHEFAELVPQLQAAKQQWDARVAEVMKGDAASIKQFASDQIEAQYRAAQEADVRAAAAETRANEAIIAAVRQANTDLQETHPSFKTFQARLAVPGLVETYPGSTLPERISALWREVAGPAAKKPEDIQAAKAHIATRPTSPTRAAPPPTRRQPSSFDDVWAQAGEPPIEELKGLGMGRTGHT